MKNLRQPRRVVLLGVSLALFLSVVFLTYSRISHKQPQLVVPTNDIQLRQDGERINATRPPTPTAPTKQMPKTVQRKTWPPARKATYRRKISFLARAQPRTRFLSSTCRFTRRGKPCKIRKAVRESVWVVWRD